MATLITYGPRLTWGLSDSPEIEATMPPKPRKMVQPAFTPDAKGKVKGERKPRTGTPTWFTTHDDAVRHVQEWWTQTMSRMTHVFSERDFSGDQMANLISQHLGLSRNLATSLANLR